MTQFPVIWSSDVQAADWLVQRLSPNLTTVSAVIPAGFAAYARLLHPAHASDGARVRWAELGARAHVIVQPGTPFETLQQRSGWQGDPPLEGSLLADQATALAQVLVDFTTTPERCWFGVWDGYGWLYGGRSTRPLGAQARMHAPHRDYVLYTGPLGAATALADTAGEQTPNLWWPDDHAWCVASDIDLPSTYVGGPDALIERLLADQRFEALAVRDTDPLVVEQ